MVTRTIRMGINLEARAAALLVQNASKYPCRLTVTVGDREANCKSIMNLLSMAILEGQELTVTAIGSGESDALEMACKMFAGN